MQKKKIPTGIASYEKMRTQNYYTVDKTLMIKDYLERGSEVTLITRPYQRHAEREDLEKPLI